MPAAVARTVHSVLTNKNDDKGKRIHHDDNSTYENEHEDEEKEAIV